MLGILVYGDNHFIVRGPLPDRTTALALVRRWSVMQVGETAPRTFDRWQVSTRELRENIEWAVSVPGNEEISPAVTELLGEISARGVNIHDSRMEFW
jgi:hypothetical protein